MDYILYLLLIAFGAFLMLSIFQFSIYLHQKDKAYLHYSLYLFVMAFFNISRMLDARLSAFYPLSIHTVETMDSVLSNLGFLMYVNFLGVILNISRNDKLFFKSWRFIQVFVITVLVLYMILKFSRQNETVAEIIMAICSFFCLGFAMVWLIRLFRFIKETFYLLIIAGTTIAAVCIIAGLVVNYFIYNNRISFPGLAVMEIGMMIETVLLSAAMGYRLKLLYREKEIYQQSLLEETKKNEALATQTAGLLRKELDIRNWQNQVSRDLHDDVGATLSSIHVYSSVASKALDKDPVKAKDALLHINENTRRVMDNMNDIVWAMKTGNALENSLEAKLKNYGYELLTPLGINCNYLIEQEAEKKITDMEARKNILLIAKEAMNNMAKYSHASDSGVAFIVKGSLLLLEIYDNGRGFTYSGIQQGNGLKHMQERAANLGGELYIHAAEGKGTKITCKIPMTINSDA